MRFIVIKLPKFIGKIILFFKNLMIYFYIFNELINK